jgi:hypothetical protein
MKLASDGGRQRATLHATFGAIAVVWTLVVVGGTELFHTQTERHSHDQAYIQAREVIERELSSQHWGIDHAGGRGHVPTQSRIVSMQSTDPEAIPDAWERQGLKRFDQ